MRLGLGLGIARIGRGHNGGPPLPSYDAEASSYFTRAGITDADAKTAINAFIVGVKEDLTITLLDEVFAQLVLQANESAAAAVVDMTANGMDQLLVNSPTFGQWTGITRAGATDYIDTNFNPVTGAGVTSQNSFAYGFYARGPAGGGSNIIGSRNAGLQGCQFATNVSGSCYVMNNNAFSGPGDIVNTTMGGVYTGLMIASRTAVNLNTAYKDAVSLGTATNNSIAPLNQNFYLVGLNANGTLASSAAGSQVSLSFFSRGLSAGEVTALNARVATLKTAIGW